MAKPKPDRKSLTTRITGLDREHYRKTDRYARQVQQLYDQAAREYAGLAGTVFEPDPDTPFSFADYPQTKKKALEMAAELTGNVQQVIEAGQRSEWLAATQRADVYLNAIFDRSKLTPAEIKQYEDRNIEGLAAFQKRKVQGMNLSERVWKCTDQFTNQIELAIDVALGEGKSAQELSRDVRRLLNEPDRLYRRVRDKYGNLRLSKAAASYHPGRGVYRSAYQNAMRLARTEINMAYRTADWERWQKNEFIVGFRIGLSNNHTVKDRKGKEVPLKDICDTFAGDYPKTFKFVGWHPNCRCNMTPIFMSADERKEARRARLRAIIDDETYSQQPSANEVTDLPKGFTDHINAIAQRSKGWKSQPYYIRDNFKGGKISGGLSPAIPHKTPIGGTMAKPDVPPQPCTAYDTQITELKDWAYACGLDISRLDILRMAGQKEPLSAEVSRLRALAEDRRTEWQAANLELRNFVKSCDGAPADFRSKYADIARANAYDQSRYYETCIAALKQALTEAKAAWQALNKSETDPQVVKMFEAQETQLKAQSVEFNPIQKRAKAPSDTEIISDLGGGDKTKGSCASVALAYVANKAGFDVRDFRGGESRYHFSRFGNLAAIAKALGVDPYQTASGIDLMKTTKAGELYYCVTGEHAAIVRTTGPGKYEYLELQSSYDNGWKRLNASVFKTRFKSQGRLNYGFVLDIKELSKLPEFHHMMGYINTKKADQQKGAGGTIK